MAEDNRTKGINVEDSKEISIDCPKISNTDEAISVKSSEKIEIKNPKIKNKSKSNRNWWLIISAITGIILVALTANEQFADFPNNKSDLTEVNESKKVTSDSAGSTGIKIEGSSNVVSRNNTIVGFDTGIEVINSRNVSSTDDTIIGP